MLEAEEDEDRKASNSNSLGKKYNYYVKKTVFIELKLFFLWNFSAVMFNLPNSQYQNQFDLLLQFLLDFIIY